MRETVPGRVAIVEVGPRDGLQNESEILSTEAKVAFVQALADAGLRSIEATSFVNPRRIPQLADAVDLMRRLERRAGVVYSALVPNEKGLERAAEAGVERVAIFTAASDAFNEKNLGQGVEASLKMYRGVVARARALGMTVRGYVSTCFGCPYEGTVEPARVRQVAEALLEMGADEVSLGDTIGVAVPTDVDDVLSVVLDALPADRLALHFHDSSGTALANVVAAMRWGITTFDASAGGLGGCPYAPGASGNLATEDLVYLLDGMSVESGVSLPGVIRASLGVEAVLGRPLPSRVLQRLKSGSTRCAS